MLNYLPVKVGVSSILITKTIMSGETLCYKQHLWLNIGHYFQVNEHEDIRNSQLSLTKGSIFLGPSVNERGGVLFMILNSAKKITKRSWETIPVPDTAIARVNKLSWNEPNQFIFIYFIVHPIGYINITVVDRDSADSNENQAPQDPLHEFQET